jgi:virginiamycin B lyase
MSKTSFAGLTAVLLCAATLLPAQSQSALPQGNGRDQVQAACAGCHSLNTVMNAGFNTEGWQREVTGMIGRGAKLTPDQVPVVVEYLTTNFPPQPTPKAVLIPGTEKVSFQEWDLPTANSFPHDPLAAPDGSIWYTGFMINKLGRVDPATGAIREYPLKTPKSDPHGLVADKIGNVWFTAHEQPYIGKINAETGEVTEYKIPEVALGGHTPLFDQKGNLWFTLITSGRIGWLNPRTGDVKIGVVSTPRSLPYGLVITSKGVPIFAEFGTNKLAKIDPATMEVHEWTLPDPDTRIRRLAITADDIVYYADFERGNLVRFDPQSGKVTGQWASPSGPKSQPYGIAVLHDAIWYVESGTEPNALVRFDPKTQKFQTWGIPGGGGVVRNMMVTPDGDHLVIAESGVNKVGLITVERHNAPATRSTASVR